MSFPPPFSSSFAGCRIRNIHIYIHNSNNNTALNAFDNSVIFRSSECFVCWLSARVCAEEVGGSSLCSLKGKYKARTKLGAQAGKTAGKAREGKVVGICWAGWRSNRQAAFGIFFILFFIFLFLRHRSSPGSPLCARPGPGHGKASFLSANLSAVWPLPLCRQKQEKVALCVRLCVCRWRGAKAKGWS